MFTKQKEKRKEAADNEPKNYVKLKNIEKIEKKMAGIEDSGRCLMDEINALFAPPGRGVAKNLKELHPYYKRPGKKRVFIYKNFL